MTDVRGEMVEYARAQAKARAERKKDVKKLKGIKPKPKKGSRVGKLGIVRLVGGDLMWLRFLCFARDEWTCVECDSFIVWGRLSRNTPKDLVRQLKLTGYDAEADAWLPAGEMAHIRTKRNNGDTLDNVRTLCPDCHRLEHNGGKPVPSKKNCGISQ